MGSGQENSDPFIRDEAFEEDELKGRAEVAGHNEKVLHASGSSTCARVMHRASGGWSLLHEAIMGSDEHNLEELHNMLMDGEAESGEATEDDEEGSVMSNSLEGVDEILRNSGRLNTSTPSEGPAAIHVAGSEPALGSSCDVATPRPHQANALGTCSQAADPLKARPAPSTDPSDAVVTSDVLPSEAIGEHNSRKSAGSSSVKCPTSGGDTNVFQPKRRQPRKGPYIRTEGLTLTYAQAKLFGLAVSDSPSIALANVLEATRASSWCVSPGAVETRRLSSSLCARRRPRGRTYSASRMEYLARPVLSGGARGAHERGRRQEASFTWKRSRKAEAAMRDPACGYDFVRDGTRRGDENDFLRRMEAYASYNTAKLQTMRAEQEYDARLNKMECPQCRNPQSYDEFINKRLLCPGCNVKYCKSRTWQRNVWEQRNRMYVEKSEQRRERAERQAGHGLLKSSTRETQHGTGLLLRQSVGQARRFIDKFFHNIISAASLKINQEAFPERPEKDDFVRRMRSDLQRRRQREATSGNTTDCQQRPPPVRYPRHEDMPGRRFNEPNDKKMEGREEESIKVLI